MPSIQESHDHVESISSHSGESNISNNNFVGQTARNDSSANANLSSSTINQASQSSAAGTLVTRSSTDLTQTVLVISANMTTPDDNLRSISNGDPFALPTGIPEARNLIVREEDERTDDEPLSRRPPVASVNHHQTMTCRRSRGYGSAELAMRVTIPNAVVPSATAMMLMAASSRTDALHGAPRLPRFHDPREREQKRQRLLAILQEADEMLRQDDLFFSRGSN